MRQVVVFASLLAAAIVGVYAQQPMFRARRDVVFVAVSVTQGRNPAVGLKAADFAITDNGVRQAVDAVESDQVPIDVTLVLTGRSADRNVEHERSLVSAEATRRLLQPADRLRMVWVKSEVAGRLVGADYSVATDRTTQGYGIAIAGGIRFSGPPPDGPSQEGIALADGLFYALAWPVDADRRHLVVAFTDGYDTSSTIEMDTLPKLAAHSDAVLHAVIWAAPGEDTRNGGGINWVGGPHPAAIRSWQASYDTLDMVIRRTGGTMQRTSKTAEALAEIIADFRSSYILRYTPKGVTPSGWHELGVKIARPGSFKIRARKGYEGG